MKIQCPHCKANYKIDLSKLPVIPEGGITTTCPKCKGKIPIQPDPELPNQHDDTQVQIIACPECGHMNISTNTCTLCGKVFTKEEIEKSTILLPGTQDGVS